MGSFDDETEKLQGATLAPTISDLLGNVQRLLQGVGGGFTWGALLTSPTGYHRQALEANRAGWERGAEVWPQVTPRPLMFQFTLDSPYPLAVNEHFAKKDGADVSEDS